jgi:TPR repeat protein
MLKQFFLSLFFAVLFSSAVWAGFEEGKKAYDRQDWVRAVYHLRPAAEAGDDRAMVVLGNMYLDGYGVDKDGREALALYARAAEKGNTSAMIGAATVWLRGFGVPKNITQAMAWFGKAAKAGDQTGAFFYAITLYQGFKGTNGDGTPLDIPADHPQAYKWFQIAAKPDIGSRDDKMATHAASLAALVAQKIKPEEVEAMDKEVAAFISSEK